MVGKKMGEKWEEWVKKGGGRKIQQQQQQQQQKSYDFMDP